jgi:tetratricopeptide (TPR) repeat protein
MKRVFINYKILILCLALCLAAVGAWRVWHKNATTEPDALSAIPQPRSDSPTDQTIAAWSKKVKQNLEDDAAWVNLGDALMQKARETADVGYYSRAEAVYRKALSLNPENVSATVGVAWVYGSRHEFEQSIEWANKAIAMDAKNPGAYGLLGDAAVEMGDYEAAFEHYQKMIDLRPDLSSYSRGAHLLHLTGDTRKAIWLMEQAIAAGGPYAENTVWCRAQLALMLWGGGMLLPAEQTLQKALEQSPNNAASLAAMGKIKASQKDYSAAIDYYKKAIAIAPQHEYAVALGELYTLTGQKEEAEKQYALVEEIARLNKANGVRGDIQIARFYADHDRNLTQALEEAETVYQTRKNVFVADTLAWCYYKNGRYEEAGKTIRKALSQQTPDANILFHAGMIYARLGDRPEAEKYLYQALSLNPNFHLIYAPVAADALKQLGARHPESDREESSSGGSREEGGSRSRL